MEILRNAGAVIFARTTEPQGMMQLETDSNLYGVTVNPFNTDLSAGGSSGGEAALMGCGGSVLGVGTDVGGRYPPVTMTPCGTSTEIRQDLFEYPLQRIVSMV